MAVKTYKKGSNVQLSTNFRAYEFDCNCSRCKETLIDEKLVDYLQQIRDHFGKPIGGGRLTAYRCPGHNAEVPNAAKGSRHTMGMAADISIEGVKPAEIAKYAESIGVLGIGLYDTSNDGHFVHIDTRTTKSYWFGHAQQRRTTFGGAKPATTAKLTVDGLWGKSTTIRLQQIFGTTADGIVSNQNASFKASNPGLCSGFDWQTTPNGKGSQLIKAMQAWAGMSANEQDGKIGPKTIKAFQAKLGTTVDGKVSYPSAMVRALQTWANSQG